MIKEKILQGLSDDFKRQHKNNLVAIIILSVLVVCLCAMFFYVAYNGLIYNDDKKVDINPIIFVIIPIILIPVIVIFSNFSVHKTVKKGQIIYNSVSLTPDKIVWFYKKVTSRNNAKSYSIFLCDDAKNIYETARVSKEEKQDELWKNLNEGCRNAVKGYRPEWYSIYYKNPADFRNGVLKYEEQFKK